MIAAGNQDRRRGGRRIGGGDGGTNGGCGGCHCMLMGKCYRSTPIDSRIG
jgi:hypothetical protein